MAGKAMELHFSSSALRRQEAMVFRNFLWSLLSNTIWKTNLHFSAPVAGVCTTLPSSSRTPWEVSVSQTLCSSLPPFLRRAPDTPGPASCIVELVGFTTMSLLSSVISPCSTWTRIVPSWNVRWLGPLCGVAVAARCLGLRKGFAGI